MQDARSKSPGSGALPACPTCGKRLDPLRAGEVSILDGKFVYFCDRSCKASYYEVAVSSRVTTTAVTADPPPVSDVRSTAARSGVDEIEASPSTLRSIAAKSGVVEEPSAHPSAREETPHAAEVEERDDDATEEPKVEEAPEAPVTSAPPSIASARAAPQESIAASEAPSRDLLLWGGVGFGALSGAVAVVGPIAEPVRLPLAALATLAFVARAPRSLRDASLPPLLASLAAPLVALVVAIAARFALAPTAPELASFAGLAAASSLLALVMTERLLAPFAAERARIEKALDVPVRAVSRGNGDAEQLSAREVKPGEEVVALAGDVLGVDAVVTAGEATVTPWLGASHEAVRKEGDAVVAGARVVRGRLRLMATWTAQERAWVRVATSSAHRLDVAAPLARGARLIAPRAALAAALLLGAALVVTDGSVYEAAAAAAAAWLALGSFGLVAAIAAHHARAQLAALEHGIAYKDPASFHHAGATDVAVLCARGTVLLGEPEIVALETLGAVDEQRVLSLAAGAETVSTHPFASAIVRSARARGVAIENVRNANEHAGLGVTALSAAGEHLVVGSRALLLQERVSVALADARISELEAEGRSVLLIALNDKLSGLLALQDGLRAGARAAVQRLHDARIEPVLLSGEARDTCETIGRALDVDHIRPEVLPAERGAEVRALREGGHVVAVLGRPQTDDPALGAGDVSIALGAAGSTPGEWSVGLASDDVRDAALALCLARTTRDRARVTLGLGLAVPVVSLLAVAFGLAPLVVVPLAVTLGTAAALSYARR